MRKHTPLSAMLKIVRERLEVSMIRLDVAFTYLLLRPCFRVFLRRWFSLEIQGEAHLKTLNSHVILAGNHEGLLDGPMLISGFNRPVRFLMAREVFSWGLIGKLIRFTGVLPIDQESPRKALTESLR
jgi:1-acyl-sn-glycerol-3-phosphate acyltransferase